MLFAVLVRSSFLLYQHGRFAEKLPLFAVTRFAAAGVPIGSDCSSDVGQQASKRPHKTAFHLSHKPCRHVQLAKVLG